MLVQVTHGGDRRARALDEPTPTIAGHGELGIVTMRNNTGPAHVDEPASTLCGGGYHHGLLAYNGTPGFIRTLNDAAGTVTTRDKQALLVPYTRTGVARTVEEPSGTLTTRDREAFVVTDDDIDACYFRMLQWPELLRAQVMHVLPDGTPYIRPPADATTAASSSSSPTSYGPK
jgi:DNA (cytosine-5)-methyltransferase 1